MTFPVVAGTNSYHTGTNSTSHALNLPASIANGDLLIEPVGVDGTGGIAWPGGHTESTDQASGGGSPCELSIAYRFADGSEGSTVTITTANEKASSLIFRITGWDGTTPPEFGTPATGTSANPDPPSLTPSWGAADTLWIVVAVYDSDGTITCTGYPTNFSDNQSDINDAATGTVGCAVATRATNASSQDPGTFTLSSSREWVAQTIAVRPASGAVLAGGIQDTDTATGDLSTSKPLAGAVTDTDTATGALSTSKPLAGAVTDDDSATGNLSTSKPLAGAVQDTDAATGNLTVLRRQILTRRFNAYLRFSSYKYGINEEYRAAAWHTPLLVDIPEPEERLKDDYGIIQADELSVEVADTALRAVLEGGTIVGASAIIEQVLSLTYTDGTTAERSTTRGYTVTAYQYRPGTVTLELADLEVERLEALYPAALFTAADFSAILADSINKPVPVVVGSAKLVPCTQVDAAVKVFACCVYSAGQTIDAVYRNGRLVNSSEYTVGSATYGAITVKKITFTREQIDFSGNNYKLEADITGSLSGNAVTELARILAAAGMTTDSTSFTAGESVATSNKMLVGWAYSAQRTFSAIVRELCLICRASLRRNDAGAWVLVQDVSQTAAASYDAETDLVEIDSYDSGKPPDTVELAFGTNPLKNHELAYTLTRDGGGATGTERYTAPMLQDKEGGDRLCCYLAQRDKHCATSRVRIHDDAITLGSRLTLTASAVWSGAKDWIARGIRRGAGWADCDLREYHADVYTYVSGTLPTSPSTGYGSTPATPSAPTAAQGTGKTIRVTWTALTVAPARYYIYRSAGGGGYTKAAEISGTEWTDTNVAYGTAYLYKVSAVDGYLNESAQSSASGSVTPAKITASSEVAAGTVGNTELGTNSVGNSNIQDSAVDTAEIAAAAVSATTSASTDGGTTLTSNTQTTVQSLAVSTEGGSVLLDFGCTLDMTFAAGDEFKATLLRDSTTLVTDLTIIKLGTGMRLVVPYNDVYVDAPSAGSYTYYLKVTAVTSGANGTATKRTVRATELKK